MKLDPHMDSNEQLVPSFIALLLIALSSLKTNAAPPCPQIVQMMAACTPYLADRAPSPFGPCCTTVVALGRSAPTQADRVAMCNCLKGVSPRFPNVDSSRISSLPSLCGVTINFTITPFIDCHMYSLYLPFSLFLPIYLAIIIWVH
ncbi:putative plant non-specific lipid-transfer protein/Par allergen [Dioscorea sansibarensis]